MTERSRGGSFSRSLNRPSGLALRIDDGGRARRLVADEIRRVGETVE
jgi:hypothetical protein